MNKVAIVIVVLSLQNVFSQVTLMDTTNRYDYVIITVPEFVATCEVFLQHKENVRDLKTLVVDTTMILNEFNSNTLMQDNIREFISYAGTFWEEPQPKYFLLIGNLNMIPNFEIDQSFGFIAHSDYLYSQSIYDNDLSSVEFYIGRIPASNTVEVNNYLNKVINYEIEQNIYPWNNNSLFIAGFDSGGSYLLHNWASGIVSNNLPSYINSNLILEYDTSNVNYLRESFLNFINSEGMSSVWLFISGNDSSLGFTNFFSINDIEYLTNVDKPFISFSFGYDSFGNDSIVSFSSEFLLSEGGSVAGIAPVGISFWTSMRWFSQMYASNLYLYEPISLGEVLDIPQGIGNAQKMIMNLWGDPSFKLKYNVTVDVDPVMYSPIQYSLEQNYPNPFNPKTVINFSISASGNVKLNVYNVLGKEIKVLTDKFYTAGNHKVEFDGSDLSSGVYLYTIRSGDFHQTRKMILIK